MRKIASLLTMLMLFCVLAFAQTRTVTGTVRDDKGDPIPFATVTEAGTRNAVQADANGAFSIKIGESSRLTVSATGFTAQTLTVTGNTSSVALVRSEGQMQEVVVTALGIRRKAEEIGYSTARVTPEQITAGKSFNLAQSLSGKVSGLTISNTSNSVNAAPRIVLRGLRSLTGNNTALIVLDGVQVPSSTINFINPNDVERIDVMKGGQAATLFGSEGVNGAIVITTKKGGNKPEVTFSHTNNIEKLAFLPRTQHGFGSGSAYGADQAENFHPAENQQFGPRYDGSIRPLGRAVSDGSILLVPYSDRADMRKDFWNTGNTGQTDFSYRSGDANSSFFASFQNLKSNGIVEGDEYNRNSFRLNAGRTYGKIGLTFDANYNWDHADRTNTDFYFFALNTPSWVPIKELRDWKNNKYADPSGYFNDYYNNPWWLLDNNRFETRSSNFNTNVKFNYKPLSSLDFTARVAVNANNGNTTTTSNLYNYNGFSKTGAYVDYFNNNYDRLLTGVGRYITRTPIPGGNGESQSSSTRITGDVFGNYSKEFGDVSFKALVGSQAISVFNKAISASTNGIGVPDLYNFGNSATGLFAASNGRSEQRKLGVYGDVTLGYKGWAYLHGSVRNDYTSLFSGPDFGYDNPSFTTYGADVSFIITDIIPSLKGGVVDNLKIRAGYNKNGNDNLGTNSLQLIYPAAAGYPYAGLLGTSVGNTVVSPELTPEIVKTAEVGFELGLFKNRVALEGTLYNQSSERQILDVAISGATGSSVYRLNAADVSNQGYELDAKVNALRNKDWNVNLNANYAYNTNEVKTLYGATGLNSLEYQSPDARASLNAEVGQMFPYLKTTVFQRDPQGRVIVDTTDGWPLRADARVGQGTTLPKHVLGLGFNVGFKNLTLMANAEYRGGHVVYHDLGTDMAFTGSGAITAIYDRETFVWPNSVYTDASGKIVPNTNYAVGSYQAIYQGFGDQGYSRGFNGIGEVFVSSGAFWKLRDLSLAYDLPATVLNKIKAIRGISLTAWARNLVTILPADNWYTDPEFANTNGNSSGINTTLNTPPTRQFGGTIKVVF